MAKNRKIPFLRFVLGFITVVIGVFIVGLLINMLSDDVEGLLKQVWGEKNHLFYLLGIGAVSLLLLLATYYLENREEEAPPEMDTDTRQQLLSGLKRRYESRLQQKMNKELRFEIKLKLKYTKDHTSPETTEHFVIQHEKNAGDFDKLFETYLHQIRRLLILGEPGAGKTVLLLRFALQLIKKAEQDPEFPIPVILNLASWQDKGQTFSHWLEQNLPYSGGEYGISKEFSKTLVQQNSILPLLDGFDEIAEDYRDSCLEKLYPYLQRLRSSRKATWPEAVLCSRIIEYEAAADAPVFAIVKIQPLRFREVESALKPLVRENDIPAKELMESLQRNPLLREATTSAFYVHTLLNLFSSKKAPQFSAQTKAEIQAEIIAIYVQTQTAKMQLYPYEKTNLWLGWLAWQMKYRKRAVTFELADMQPDWARKGYIYNFFFGLIVGIVMGSTTFGIVGSILGGLTIGLMTGFGYGIQTITISTVDIVEFDFKRLKWRALVDVFVGGIVGGIFFNVFFWTVFGLVFGLAFGIFSGIVFGLFETISTIAKLPKLNTPYHRLKSQLWRDAIQWTLSGSIVMGIAQYLANYSSNGFWVGAIGALFISIFTSPLFKHWVLVFVLYHERVIPLKYPEFLNTVADNSGLLEKDGGHWRFRHQLLQDYFATWFEETHVDLLSKNWQEVKTGKR
jgi:hypothetical protein